MTYRAKRILLISLSAVLMLLLLAFGLLFGYQKAYAGKIYKNIYFSDIDLSGKTKKQAESLLKARFLQVLNKEITLKVGLKEVKATLSDTGLSFDVNQVIDDSYSTARTGNFFRDIYLSSRTIFTKKTVTISPRIESEKYNNFAKIAVAQFNTESKDATLAINNGVVTLTDHIDGITVDSSGLADRIINSITMENPVLELKTIITPAKITNDNYTQAKADAENIINKTISFTFADKVFTPTKSDIGSWISFSNNNGTFTTFLNDSNAKAYLNKIATSFQIIKVDKKINASDGTIVQEGKQGLYLDKDKTLQSLKSSLSKDNIVVAMTTYTEDPAEVKVTVNQDVTTGKYTGKYVDVNVTTQRLCRVDGQALIDCFPISSGKPSTPTPLGEFTILEKSARHWSSEFSMWLPWWQKFQARGYGLHELPETSTWKETSAHLGTAVSHGCVRLDVGTAELVYNWTEVGNPVYVHK